VIDDKLRSALEIATAVLLGLVSVATAAGAYQSSQWAQQSGEYASIAGELRDASLSTFITSDLISFDDTELLFEALELEFQIEENPPNVADLIEQRDLILAKATPGVAEQWPVWVAGGFDNADFPTSTAQYVETLLAPTYSANKASSVAYEAADSLTARSVQQAVAAAIFALALLLLGVSGANTSLKVAFGLAVAGAAAFVGGLVISVLAVIG